MMSDEGGGKARVVSGRWSVVSCWSFVTCPLSLVLDWGINIARGRRGFFGGGLVFARCLLDWGRKGVSIHDQMYSIRGGVSSGFLEPRRIFLPQKGQRSQRGREEVNMNIRIVVAWS